MPRVSILVPTYNYARFLPEAIESSLAQEFADFELIISDDASTDGSADLIRQYAQRDPRVRVQIHAQNLGMVDNWNWCLRAARGDYIKFMFGDDRFIGRESLGRLVAMLDTAPGATLAASARLVLDEKSRTVATWSDWPAPGRHPGGDVLVRCVRADRNLIGEPSCVLFPRHAAERGFDPKLRQVVDLEMWFHLLTAGDFVYTPDPLCAFRRHAAQQTEVNRKNFVGPTESLVILARYLDHVRAQEPSPAQHRQMLFRRLYYYRKHAPRGSAALPDERHLRAILGPAWYFLLWLRHRLLKPLVNLTRWLRGRPPPTLDPAATSQPAA
jgi:glycosyltransferase involved in cell wall biosynthesis